MSLVDLRESLQNDLICWTGDKNLEQDDIDVMCQIVVDNIKHYKDEIDKEVQKIFSYPIKE